MGIIVKKTWNEQAVLRGFEASGKRHLLITGGRKSGKTTLLKSLVAEELPGIVTWAEKACAVHLMDKTTKEQTVIGVFDEHLPGPDCRMRPVEEGFTSLGIPTLERLMLSSATWVMLDEIGYLESASPMYCQAVRKLFDEKRVIAVVRKGGAAFAGELLGRQDCFTVDLDEPYGKAGCVIMASGLGKRFGTNKLTHCVRGKPMIEWVLDTTDEIFRRRVVVTRHEDVAEICRKRGVETVLHDLPYRSDTVRLGLEAIGSDCDSCLFCQGDQPLLTKESVCAILLAGDGKTMLRAAYGENAASPVLFPRMYFGELMMLPEGKGGGVLLQRYPHLVKEIPVTHPAELWDIDTPEDLAEMENIEQIVSKKQRIHG